LNKQSGIDQEPAKNINQEIDMCIRNTAKAIILDPDNKKVLLNRCFDRKNGEYFSLPGGGQNKFETLHDAVERETLEETGYEVIPAAFVALCEEICEDQYIRDVYPEYAHKMYHIFRCSVSGKPPVPPTGKDDMQLSTEWIDISDLKTVRLLPKVVGDNIDKLINAESAVFLGSEHIQFNHG
jgi:ADP-ribose pyrophosphatase YjhB (NUDIX family)